MKILAWDTSGRAESVAVLNDGALVAQQGETQVSSHSERLLPMIQQVLEQAGLSLPQIDLFAVTVGPGSFTGLRIGLSTAKALAVVYSKPVAAVNTLLALAEPALQKSPGVLACMDARLREVYVAAYENSTAAGGFQETLAPECVSVIELQERAAELSGPSVGVGSGFLLYPELPKIFGLAMVENPTDQVDAAAVGRVAIIHAQRGELLSGRELQARYLRLSEAENRLRRKQASITLPERDSDPIR